MSKTIATDATTAKSEKSATNHLGQGKVLPLVFKLTIPSILSQLIIFLYNMVDRIFVSKIGDGGTDALAALGIVLPVTLIMQAFANLIGMGAPPRASIKIGEGDENEANAVFNTSVSLLLVISILLGAAAFVFARQIVQAFGCPSSAIDYAVSYLKIYACGTPFVMLMQGLNPFITAQGYSFFSMISVCIGALLNVLLDPLFIFVFRMGVAGAALATVLSQLVSCVWIICFFSTKKSVFRFDVSKMKLKLSRVLSIFSLGVSPFFMTLTECAIQIVFSVNLKRATFDNSDYTAALTIMLSALQFISLPLNGLGYGMQPFVSYNYGTGDEKRLKEGIKDVTIIAFIFAAVLWGVSIAVPQAYARIFSASAPVAQIVKSYAPLFLMGSIMFFVQMTLQDINVALGQGKTALLLAFLRKIVILIPLCYILTHFYGAKGVYLSEGIADFVAGAITAVTFLITFPRVFKRRAEEVRQKALNAANDTTIPAQPPQTEQ